MKRVCNRKDLAVKQLLILGLSAMALVLPAAAARQTLPQRIASTKKILSQAAATSKQPRVKQQIAQVQVMIDRQQFQPAKNRVSELKRTAALGGDAAVVVTRLIDAEDAIGDIINKRRNDARKRR